ncbi:eukaryotic translation initiation factor 3G1 [Trifolium repens]|nr:eukaryotic translation initiation factor 3G1 [Trifolium repens]
MNQSEFPKVSSSSRRSILKVEGKRVQEDVGGRDPSKLPKISSSHGSVSDITRSELPKMSEKVEGKHVGDPSLKRCVCGRYCYDDECYEDTSGFEGYPSAESRYYGEMLSMMVPSYMYPFVDKMAAKPDDKTLVVISNITCDIRDDDVFLELFKQYGEVISANLLPALPGTSFLGEIGFVTFVSKEDAEQAMYALNGSGPRGPDKRILTLDWASILKKSR